MIPGYFDVALRDLGLVLGRAGTRPAQPEVRSNEKIVISITCYPAIAGFLTHLHET